ncbi:hypothetical protein K8R62_00160 [bacterium]|nr:hypothetical protein [bacterium]
MDLDASNSAAEQVQKFSKGWKKQEAEKLAMEKKRKRDQEVKVGGKKKTK